jgi:hypothetical protein
MSSEVSLTLNGTFAGLKLLTASGWNLRWGQRGRRTFTLEDNIKAAIK